MVRITDGKNTVEVPVGAYRSIFKPMGYRPVKNDKRLHAEVHTSATDAAGSEDKDVAEFLDMVAEKPLSQWNKDEVKRYAAIKEIDITGTKNPNEAKQLIKEYMSAHGES